VLYIAWKARLLQTSPMAEAEKNAAYEELQTVRDALTERLTQFAVGTQSNTAEGVKQCVSFQSDLVNPLTVV
jgi:hypothetical protein